MKISSSIPACALMLIVSICGCEKKAPPPAPPPSVVVAVAEEKPVSLPSTMIAQVRADEEVRLAARVKGRLEKKNFKEGQPVRRGDVLYEIEPYEYEADVKAAEAGLLRSQAEQKNATTDFERQKTLLKQDAVSQRNYDSALSKKMESDAGVMSAEAKLAQARLNLSYTKVTAPFDGLIGLATYSVGNIVGPESASLATVVSNNPVRVEFAISETDLLNYLKQTNTFNVPDNKDRLVARIIFQDGSAYTENGAITFWNNQVNPSTGTILMQAAFSNPQSILIPGMYVKIQLFSPKPEICLLAPQAALLEDQTGQYMLVVGKGEKVEKRKVKTGQRHEMSVVVQEGLKPGERVIVQGIQKARPGMAVQAVSNAVPPQAGQKEGASDKAAEGAR